jgi:hypothetical protein
MDIVGHESKAVSQLYTDVGDDEKRAAVAKLPTFDALLHAAQGRGAWVRAKDKKPRRKGGD